MVAREIRVLLEHLTPVQIDLDSMCCKCQHGDPCPLGTITDIGLPPRCSVEKLLRAGFTINGCTATINN